MKACPNCGHSLSSEEPIRQWLLRKLALAGPHGLNRRELSLACAGRRRARMREVLSAELVTGVIVEKDRRFTIY